MFAIKYFYHYLFEGVVKIWLKMIRKEKWNLKNYLMKVKMRRRKTEMKLMGGRVKSKIDKKEKHLFLKSL